MNLVGVALLGWMVAPSNVPPADAEHPPAAPRAELHQDAKGYEYALELDLLPLDQRDEAASIALFEQGQSAYESGRFRDAIELFEAAYRIGPTDNTVYTIGRAHNKIYERETDATHYRLAVHRYNSYLEAAGTTGVFSDTARANLERLAALRAGETPPTRLIVTASVPGAWMEIDGADRRPAGGGVTVEPGLHVVRVGADQHETVDRQYRVEEGQRLSVSLDLVPLPGVLRLRGPRRARVEVDGIPQGELPLEAVEVAAGRRTVVVLRRGRVPFARSVAVGPAQTIDLDATTGLSPQRVFSFTLFGLGGAAIATSAVTTGLAFEAQRRANDLELQRREANLTSAEYNLYESLVLRRDRLRAASIATFAGGSAVAAAGLVLLLFERPRVDGSALAGRGRHRTQLLGVSPMLGPDLGGSARIRF